MAVDVAQAKSSAYPKTAAILALAGGMLMVLGGVLFIGVASFVIPHMNFSNVTVPNGMDRTSLPGLISGILSVMGGFGLVCGAIVLVSATMLLAKVGTRRTWGILILVFSVLSFVGLGGFVLGAILGIVGGVLALRWNQPIS
jgi:ABC-type branched-subunit amino acid transport system ATPase component